MRRSILCTAILSSWLATMAAPASADEFDDMLKGGPESGKKPSAAAKKPGETLAPGEEADDVIVAERKFFLRRKRFEVGPAIGATLNDQYLRHLAVGATLNYHITEVMAVGLTGLYFFPNRTEVIRDTVRLQSVPLLNKYDLAIVANFSYIPFYGKFAVFNQWVAHWDMYLSAGVGILKNTVLLQPNFLDEGDTHWSLTVDVGMGARIYPTKWISVYAEVRDHFLLMRPEESEDAGCEDGACNFLAGNLMFMAGVSFFFPTAFEYTTAP